MIDRTETVRKLVMTAASYSGLARLSESFLSGIGVILMLHRVTEHPGKPLGINSHLSVTPSFLDATIAEMKRIGFTFTTMDGLVERLDCTRPGERLAVISLDDAYRDNLVEALPIFEKHETPFIIHAAPGLIDGRAVIWWELVEDIVAAGKTICLPTSMGTVSLDCDTPADRFAAARTIMNHISTEVPEREQIHTIRGIAHSAGLEIDSYRRELLMTWDELRMIAAHPLGEIGAHTVNHHNLRRLDEQSAMRELKESARILEDRLGSRPRHMAYPYGFAAAVGPREVELAREAGYLTAVTTRHGVLQPDHSRHLHALPRISLNGRYQKIHHLRTMLSGFTTALANHGRRLVTV